MAIELRKEAPVERWTAARLAVRKAAMVAAEAKTAVGDAANAVAVTAAAVTVVQSVASSPPGALGLARYPPEVNQADPFAVRTS